MVPKRCDLLGHYNHSSTGPTTKNPLGDLLCFCQAKEKDTELAEKDFSSDWKACPTIIEAYDGKHIRILKTSKCGQDVDKTKDDVPTDLKAQLSQVFRHRHVHNMV